MTSGPPLVAELAGGTLDPAGPEAEGAVELWWLMVGLGGAVFALVLVLLVLGLRRSGDEDLGTDPATAEDSIRGDRWLLGGGVVLPLVVVGVVLVATIAAMDAISVADDEPGALIVDVTGHQWWWQVSYPELGIDTANEVHVPAGEPVVIELRSADVIHSFWVPELAGKLDALPERTNRLVIEADAPGRYPARCAEFCGLQHANMDFAVIAHAPADFERWADGARQPATTPSGAGAEGAEVFRTAGCASCHRIAGITTASDRDRAPSPGRAAAVAGDPRGWDADRVIGPDLTHLASRNRLGGGVLPVDADSLRRWLHDPDEFKTGSKMPPAELGDDDLDALVAFLEGLE